MGGAVYAAAAGVVSAFVCALYNGFDFGWVEAAWSSSPVSLVLYSLVVLCFGFAAGYAAKARGGKRRPGVFERMRERREEREELERRDRKAEEWFVSAFRGEPFSSKLFALEVLENGSKVVGDNVFYLRLGPASAMLYDREEVAGGTKYTFNGVGAELMKRHPELLDAAREHRGKGAVGMDG